MDKKFKYEEELKPFKPFIYENYQPFNGIVYRNFLSDPPTEKDFTPQSKRPSDDQPLAMPPIITDEQVATMPDRKKAKYVGSRALSVYETLEACVSSTMFWVDKIAQNYSLADAEVYIMEKRGNIIYPVRITEDMGMMEKEADETGHRNFLPYDDVEWDKAIVREAPPTVISPPTCEEDVNGGEDKSDKCNRSTKDKDYEEK